MGLLDLGQALAQFDALKRRVGLLASNPSGFAAGSSGPELGNAGPYPGGLLSVMPQVREQAINEALRLTPGLLGATVYHGSPYQFEKFDASKIGTGEGAQAYGYGHYLADNPQVAKTYAKEMSNQITVNGKTLLRNNKILGTTGDQGVDDLLVMHFGDIDKAIADARLHNDAELPKLLALKATNAVKATVGGTTYRVDLPDEAIAKMLDWDKPLSQQSEAVRTLFESSDNPMFTAWKKSGAWPDHVTGGIAYNDLAHGNFAAGRAGVGAMGTAEKLQSAGIPGIKYLDQGSRAAGKGTMNYVIFPGNEGLLKILGRE